MWKAAIQAIKFSDQNWIQNNLGTFGLFFESENEMPAGKLGKTALEYHYEERLFKMFLSAEYDGLALSPAEAGKLIENASALSSDWGWLLAIGVGGGYFADYLHPDIACKYFLPKEALVAGSGKPDGKAVKIADGQFEVSGSWRYCSGCEQASLFTAVTLKAGKPSAFVLPKGQAWIKRDWKSIGLRLTCSHKVTANQAKIPADHFFDLSSGPRPSGYPISSYPFMGFAKLCCAPVILGITRGTLYELQQYLQIKEKMWKQFQPERYAIANNTLREMKLHIATLQYQFYEIATTSWERHLKEEDPQEEEVNQITFTIAEYCYDSVAGVLPVLGMAVLDRDHPLQQRWQDLQTARQHTAFQRF